MRILCVFGQHNYGNPERGLGYEYNNFIPALKSLGHEVIFFESLNKSLYSDYADMNRKLLQMVEQENPDIIFCVLMTYETWLETLQLIREGSDTALIHWATDDSWKYEQASRFLAPMFDIHATTYLSAIRRAEEDGLDNFVLTQWAADSSRMLPPLKAVDCRYQVSFIGSTYGNRQQWVEELKQRGVHVETFGYGWPNGPVAAEDVSRIMRESRISLNFGDSGMLIENGKPVRSRQIKARVFEVPGAGGLLATEPADYLEDYFEPGKEIVVFEDIDDLIVKIKDLLAHPGKRDAIARAGYERVKAEHSYESRFEVLIEQVLERRSERPAATHGIDFEHFEMIANSHQPNVLLILLKYLLLLPCMLIWGRQRGPRAARRFLFEFSWRVMGRKTYSAAGWPGRIFYKQS
ncbi:MAG: glycosyltransferase [Mariprofundaceae bacterium]|nr:glycosyltransferase [Mariprofundaceae bacterium]